MELGVFSVSLASKNLDVSKSFYENLGFYVFGGNAAQNWLIMKKRIISLGFLREYLSITF